MKVLKAQELNCPDCNGKAIACEKKHFFVFECGKCNKSVKLHKSKVAGFGAFLEIVKEEQR